VPLPFPLAPEVIVIHPTDELAVQPHALVVVTEIRPVDAVAATLADVGDALYVHVATGAAWLMLTVLPAAVIVPLRAAPVLAATE
jgi:hypothetical protein